MLLPKFDILNKIKKERTITLANAIIIAFAAFVVFTVLQTLGIVNLFSIGIYCLFVDWHFYFFRYDNLVF